MSLLMLLPEASWAGIIFRLGTFVEGQSHRLQRWEGSVGAAAPDQLCVERLHLIVCVIVRGFDPVDRQSRARVEQIHFL